MEVTSDDVGVLRISDIAAKSDVRVFMRHIRQAKLCAGGTRRWWRDNGLDWSDFLANGILADDLAATGDPMALRVVECARNES